MINKRLLFAFSFLISYSIVMAQSKRIERIDSLFNVLSNSEKAMGSIVISDKGNISYQRSFGYCIIDSTHKVNATNKSKYRIGSVTELFTATVIFQLIEEGKISLSTHLTNFFGEIPGYEKIKIGMILAHRSGIHNYANDPDDETFRYIKHSNDEILKKIIRSGIDFQPNAKSQYSNSNYFLLGLIIEKIENKPYHEVLNERIFSKIGLSDTYYGDKIKLYNFECYSYKYSGKWIKEKEFDVSNVFSAGALTSNPTDLVKFIEALFNNKLISESSLSMMKLMKDEIGMGLIQILFNNKIIYGYTGIIDAFNTTVLYIPEDNMAMAYCSNGQNYPTKNIVDDVLKIYYDIPFTMPVFTTLSAKELDKYLGFYLNSEMPFDVKITKTDRGLIAQTTDRAPFPLEAIGKDKFAFFQGGVEVKFDLMTDKLLISIGDDNYEFAKKK